MEEKITIRDIWYTLLLVTLFYPQIGLILAVIVAISLLFMSGIL